jgi:cytochrome c2
MKIRLLVAAVLLLASAAHAQQPGDARRGHDLAREICSACHAVEKNIAVSPNVRAPTFRDIAARPGMSELGLYAAVRTPHPAMPRLVPDSSELRDVIAYIRSLGSEE